MIGFHLQQDAGTARTHELSFLLSRLEQIGVETDDFETLVEPNPFAVPFRHGLWMDDEPCDRRPSSQPVSDLLERVQGVLNAEA
ncbi:MAG: hypothetical protein R8K47_00830 [Mariprofundaceae bacterium]